MYLAELPWCRGCSVIRCALRGLFSFLSVFLIKLHLASLPLASSYSRVAVSSVFWAHKIYFSAQTRGAPLSIFEPKIRTPRIGLWSSTAWTGPKIFLLHKYTTCLKKSQNAPRTEHPPVRGGNVKTFIRWDHRLQIQNLFMAFKGVPRW